jgi:hypothetical protein
MQFVCSTRAIPGTIVAEILGRTPDGTWPQQPDFVAADGELRLDNISFAAPMCAVSSHMSSPDAVVALNLRSLPQKRDSHEQVGLKCWLNFCCSACGG